ncbi:ATP-binding cassette domain-containing protein [Desulfitobacterium chlororespirans]|uniref:ABC-2 type transport system ATP-binding protein n=1 Tax=Desulfitobacterium chlororespirans DSM 11544 TaxID=1121395 RepID=A0A1M7S619_9FIRM|nr:ABC transporter ATP-binding protein [Desulfitobacterium chlororespirans]SHN53792.1 ABC-2 type transport system ATP-binding protein [Desulfitobacterium chlororespirans DSM 11544]
MSVVVGYELYKRYGKVQALGDVSFAIEENTITGLIGRNGTGKTTLLKMMAGHLKPTQGKLRVFAQNPFDNLDVAGKVFLVDDTMAFPDSFTLQDILREVAVFYPNWNSQIAQGLLEYFLLNPQQRHSNLSKGSKSTFNAILGIAARCPLTLLDEPTTGMDSAVRKDFYRVLLKDYLEQPRTIILSSHLLGELEDILEDILLLNQGGLLMHKPILDLKQYALGFRGSAQALRESLLNRLSEEAVLHREEFVKGSLYLVIKTEELPEDFENIRSSGVEILPVALDDLCNILTAPRKGGIDDVYKRG